MKIVWYFYIHHINILHKYGWNYSLDNNVMNLYLTVCQRVQSTSNFFFNKIDLVQILVYIQ